MATLLEKQRLWKDAPNVTMLHLFNALMEGRVVYDTVYFMHM